MFQCTGSYIFPFQTISFSRVSSTSVLSIFFFFICPYHAYEPLLNIFYHLFQEEPSDTASFFYIHIPSLSSLDRTITLFCLLSIHHVLLRITQQGYRNNVSQLSSFRKNEEASSSPEGTQTSHYPCPLFNLWLT